MSHYSIDDQTILKFGLQVFNTEIQAISTLKDRLDMRFVAVCRCLLACKGRIITVGLGKSGHIARKIASTFASTGSPAFFVHATEANHGDAGMITANDLVIMISNSGETTELINMLPLLKRLNIALICLSGSSNSTLAKAATIYLEVNISQEACPLGLAPTSSTTAALVMGDALAISLLQTRGFTAQDFALYHPGGQLGKRLLLKVNDVMRIGKDIPMVFGTAKLQDAFLEMTQKNLGFTTVVKGEEDKYQLIGVYTDGDLRRTLLHNIDIYQTAISEVMTKHCKTITTDKLAAEALHHMEIYKITSLCVIDQNKYLIGVVHIHDLLTAGLV